MGLTFSWNCQGLAKILVRAALIDTNSCSPINDTSVRGQFISIDDGCSLPYRHFQDHIYVPVIQEVKGDTPTFEVLADPEVLKEQMEL